MINEALKIELIEWMSSLENDSALKFLKSFKQSFESDKDWWFDLSNEEIAGIERGLNDIAEGRLTPHSEVIQKYGL